LLDFVVAAIGARFVERNASRAEVLIKSRGAFALGIPLLFELDLTLLELRFLAAIVLDLLLELGIARLAFGLLDRERIALAGQHCQAFESLARFLGEAQLKRFGVCEAFG